MSIPRRGSRSITVGAHHYRWHVRRKPTYDQGVFAAPMTVAIERVADRPGKVLRVNLNVTRPDTSIKPHQTALKPSMVRQIIELALAAG